VRPMRELPCRRRPHARANRRRCRRAASHRAWARRSVPPLTLRLPGGLRSDVRAHFWMMACCERFAITRYVKIQRGHGACVSRDCADAPSSEPFELAAAVASPGPAEGAPATAMARSPAARSEPIMAFALIQRSNSRESSADHFRTMSRFSKTRLRLMRRTLIASRTEGEGEVVHRAEK
jgi:hypothetical protein